MTRGQKYKSKDNNLSGTVIFTLILIPCVAFGLAFGFHVLGSNNFMKDYTSYSWGICLGSLIILVKEIFLALAKNQKEHISILRSIFIITLLILGFAGILYFTVNSYQKQVDTLTLVVTIFVQNEITAKLWKD